MRRSTLPRLVALPTLAAILAIAGSAIDGGMAAVAAPGDLPQVRLDTRGPIRDNPKVGARIRVGGSVGAAAVELRGQSSQTFPKKSYGVELRRRDGSNRSAALLGLPADDDWILYAAYHDKTLMRNVVAYDTARRLGGWSARSRFVELTLNGRYQGIYVLMERVEFGKQRVQAEKAGLTGRYLLELTFDYQALRKGPFFRTPVKRRPILYEDPELRDLSARESRYARGVVGRAERALYRGGPGEWRTHLDEAAAVDYVLLQELFRNADAFKASTFMVKSAGRKLALGPVWDFDLAMANARQGRSEATQGWNTRTRVWASKLHADPGFRQALFARWRALRDGGLRQVVLASVATNERTLRPAVGRNFRRWPILNRRIWQNPAARGSFTAEVAFLRRWLTARMAWLDRATGYR